MRGGFVGEVKKGAEIYSVGCLICGVDSQPLRMWPHRHPNGKIAGWVFICLDCEAAVKGRTMKLDFID
jgi:hypothetical protein